jgi:hypothetical protein
MAEQPSAFAIRNVNLVDGSGAPVVPNQAVIVESESPPNLAQADGHRAKAVLRAVRHLKC